MATYKLLTAVTAVQPAPNSARGPQNPTKAPGPTNSNMPAQEQTFHTKVSGVGSVSVTIQNVVSNDGDNWLNYGDAYTVAGTAGVDSPAQGSVTGSQSWEWFGAYVTAISGTDASANLTMSA